MSTPVELRSRAAKLRELAKLTRQNAEFAEGQTYRQEIRQAEEAEAEAARFEARAAELEHAALSPLPPGEGQGEGVLKKRNQHP
jgi:hypothetical protein